MVDTAFATPNLGWSALNLTRLNCKAQHIFADLGAPAAGKAHCEVQHQDVNMPPPAEEDIFVGCFRAAPFLNRPVSSRNQLNCFNGQNVSVLKEQRNDIEKRKPAIALLVVFDYEELPQKSRQDVLSFLFWCKHSDGPRWNLAAAGIYGVDVAEDAFQE